MTDPQLVPSPIQGGSGYWGRHSEYEALTRQLAEMELELATLESRLTAFQKTYTRSVGVLFAELDQLEKAISWELFRLNPDAKHRQGYKEAKRKARASQEAINEDLEKTEKAFAPSEELKRLYRKVAKAVHPDLATSELERPYRTSLMARANQAYRNGDMEALEQILQEWEHRDEASIFKERQPTQSYQLQQKIIQIRLRIKEIEGKIDQLRGSELYRLMVKVEQARQEGRDLLGEMARDLRYRIREAKVLLDNLRMKEGIGCYER